MGNFEKRNIIREAENILEEYTKKDIEEKKRISKLKSDYKKVKRINLALSILVGVMAVAICIMVI